VRRFFCRLLWAFFGLGVLFGARRGRFAGGHWDKGGCGEGHGHHRGPRLLIAQDPEKRRRFRRRLREALDELLADEPEPTAEPQGEPTA
jgi:hypothetical protein